MTGQYSGDFSLNNNYGTINADTFSVKSRNINDLIDINNPETHYFFRLNKLEVINEGNINIKNIDIDAHHDRAVVLNYALLNGKNMTISSGDISLESSIRVKNAGKIEGVIGVTDKIHLNAIYAADHNLHDYSHVHASSVIR